MIKWILFLDYYEIILFIVTEYYNKGEVVAKDVDPKEDFKNLPSDTVIVRVKHGSKVRNIMGFVEKSLKVRNISIFILMNLLVIHFK